MAAGSSTNSSAELTRLTAALRGLTKRKRYVFDRVLIGLIVGVVLFQRLGLNTCLKVFVFPLVVYLLVQHLLQVLSVRGRSGGQAAIEAVRDRWPRLVVLVLVLLLVGDRINWYRRVPIDNAEHLAEVRGACILYGTEKGDNCPDDLRPLEADLTSSGCPTFANGEPAIVELFEDERREQIFTDIGFGDLPPIREVPSCGLDEDATYWATVDIDLLESAQVIVALDPQRAPITVNNFVYLANWNYYDWTGVATDRDRNLFASSVPIGGIGDPEAPGYEIEAEPSSQYPPWSVCMFGGARGADVTSHGARFYVVLPATDTSGWGDQVTCFGKVIVGQDAITRLAAAGSTTIENVVISKRPSAEDQGD